MPTPDEPDDLKLKRIEALYHLARETYAVELQRFDAAESKADRYLAFLLAIFGAAAINVDEFIDVATHSPGCWGTAFIVAFCLATMLALVALVLLLLAIGVERLLGPPVDDTLPAHFRDHRYVDAIYSSSTAFFDAARRAKTITDRKMRTVRRVHWILLLTLILAAAAVLCFAAYKIGAP